MLREIFVAEAVTDLETEDGAVFFLLQSVAQVFWNLLAL